MEISRNGEVESLGGGGGIEERWESKKFSNNRQYIIIYLTINKLRSMISNVLLTKKKI